jgi:integrase
VSKKRFLPQYVTVFKDRHSKQRFRFRRLGYPGGYFRAPLGTEEFRAEYRAFMDGGSAQPIERPDFAPGSIGDLVSRFCATPSRLGPSAVTQGKVRAVLDRFRVEHGHRMVDEVEFEHIDAILTKAAVQRVENKKKVGGIHSARKLRKELVRLFDFAIKIRMRTDNPVVHSERIKEAVADKTGGFHTWTEAEIEQYRQHHPLGSRARLAMELMLWTGQRRSDANEMGPDDVIDGRIEVIQAKGGKGLWVPMADQLVAAITAMPPPPPTARTFLLTSRGKTYSRAGFGNWFREQCDAAGLPHCSAHGLRKAIMRRMAELDMGNQTLKSVSGHSRDDQVAHYTRGADQKRMADHAIRSLSAWEVSNLSNKVDTDDVQTPGKPE